MNDHNTITSEQLLDRLTWRYATKQFAPNRKINARDWATIEEALRLTRRFSRIAQGLSRHVDWRHRQSHGGDGPRRLGAKPGLYLAHRTRMRSHAIKACSKRRFRVPLCR